jgi:hypothetical protein
MRCGSDNGKNVMDFITANKRNPSKCDAEERGKYGILVPKMMWHSIEVHESR